MARSSSKAADLVSGFIGQAFPSLASVTIETGEREYVSIAFPLRPSESDVASVLDELDEPDITRWRLGHWSPADSSYVEAADGGLESVERGQGYFLITADPEAVVEEGLTAPIGEWEIELEDGPGGQPAYNQLGNPFLFPIAVSDLMVTDGTTTVPLVSPDNTLTEAAAKVYETDTGSYTSNPAIIEARTAFWVKKLAPGPVSVIVPYQAGSEDAAALPALAKPAGARWAFAIKARQGSRTCEPILVGAAEVPAGRWNSLCLSRTPDPPGGALSLSMHEGDWGRLGGDYVRVFRPPGDAMSWDVGVRGAEWPGETTLQFEAFDLPASTRIWLSDPQDGWTREVAGGQSMSIVAKRQQSLRLTVTMEGDSEPEIQLRDGLRYVYPNPFRQRSGLVFTSARGGDVEARIYDVSGRAIRRLSASAVPAGERVLVWDGKDDAGRGLAPGIYLARYSVGDVRGVARLVKIE